MRKFFFIISTSLLMVTLAASIHNPVAAAQDTDATSIQIRVNSSQRSYACHNPGDSVQVTGSSNILNITGDCGSLQVTGSSNSVTIDSVKTVQFTGRSNAVLYKSAHRPTVSDDGQSNSIVRAAGPYPGQQTGATSTNGEGQGGAMTVNGNSTDAIVANALQAAHAASNAAAASSDLVQGVQVQGNMLNIILSKQQVTEDCGDGRFVNINGYQDDITLTGSCSKIVMNGWGNTVHIEEVATIEVMGHTNTIFWQRGRNTSKPVVQIDPGGMNNSVHHQLPASQ